MPLEPVPDHPCQQVPTITRCLTVAAILPGSSALIDGFTATQSDSISATMAGLADLFIDVTKEFNCTANPDGQPQVIPENGFGLIQLIFL